jgi:hypothetical protein
MPAVVCAVTGVSRMARMPGHILPVGGNFGCVFLMGRMVRVVSLGGVFHLMVLMLLILFVLPGMILHRVMLMIVHDYLHSVFSFSCLTGYVTTHDMYISTHIGIRIKLEVAGEQNDIT